ncbi:hypothetical protein PR048_025128 [Dryococelus australis]|uniref:Uncharacterized protein n=1 Tax=Dryococelus australis TaxID=614101 RepID=A0ABQ9GQL2_9NEOP|nr:hypothetical protein PR048_025128 [Dryococelus australis]
MKKKKTGISNIQQFVYCGESWKTEGRLPDQLSFQGNISNNFEKFIQSFETYLIAPEKDKKADNVKIALLLNLIGSEGVDVFHTFKLDEKEKGKYDSVKAEFKKYCSPYTNRTYEPFVFNSQCQESDESLDQFVNDLKKLIKSCEYVDQKDSILIDRMKLGVTDLKLLYKKNCRAVKM